MVPSASSEKGFTSPEGDRAGVLLKHMNMKMSFMVSTPPVMTTSDCPSQSSFAAIDTALKAEAQAASQTQLVPPRSRRLAMRPATTLPRSPGKLASCQGVYSPSMRPSSSTTLLSGRPASRRTLRQTGFWRRLFMDPSSSWALVTPRMTLILLLSISANWPPAASSSTRFAVMSARSWEVSVAGTMLGGTPHSSGSKGMSSRKAPRLA